MSAKVLYIAGVPASGKTTLFRRIRQSLFRTYKVFKYNSVRGINSGSLVMLGVFDNSEFEGTDKLSMTVIDDAIEYIEYLDRQERDCIVFIEGDRLFNDRFLTSVNANIILLDCSPEVLDIRHKVRKDGQNDIFLKSRRTKIENFAKKYCIFRMINDTPDDSENIFRFIDSTVTRILKDK